MSRYLTRHFPVLSLLMLLLLAPYLDPIGGNDALDNLPDLAITEFEVTPTKDGYQGYLKIKNIGPSSSVRVMVQVLDEEAGRETNRTDVVTFHLPNPGPGSEIVKEFPWEPEVPGTHILRAIVDINGDEKESNKFNNVRALMVTLPSLGSATSETDGSPDPDVFGDYISGIENIVEMELTYDGITDPSLLRSYITVPGHFLEYGTTHSSSTFRVSFDAGSLPPGKHDLVINSSYGGQHLSSKVYSINVVERPNWFDHLDKGQSFFDRELSSYVFRGRLDIPEYVFTPEVEGIGSIEPVSLFRNHNELFLSGYVLLDRTTTYDAECDMEFIMANSRSLVHQSGRSFAPSPGMDVDILLQGEGYTDIDLSSSAMGRKIMFESPYGDTIRVPVPSLLMDGSVGGSTNINIDGTGSIEDIQVNVDLEFSGITTGTSGKN